MKYRKLRIAWSVAWGVACLLLLALWVRSYSWLDAVYVAHSHCAISMRGRLYFDYGVTHTANRQQFSGEYVPLIFRFTWNGDRNGHIVDGTLQNEQLNRHVAIWSLILLCITVGGTSWLPWRFSLRTLLIGMTVVALLLGWIVYAVRE